jgi:hypothetical protein
MGDNGHMSSPAQPKRQRHLMDPNNLQRASSDASLTKVQRWVMSALAVTTILHLSAGLVIAAYAIDGINTGGKVGLLLIAAAFGLLAVASGFLIHKKSPLNPWVLLGLIPAVVGAFWVLG